MARVIKAFCDKLTWRTYRAGSDYEGVRVDELAALGFVEASPTVAPARVDEPQVGDEPTTDYESMTKAQLTGLAKGRGIEPPKRATKDALIELLRG